MSQTGRGGEGSRYTVDLYVRSLAPRVGRDRLSGVVRDLKRLERNGTIDALHVRVIGDAVPPSPGQAVTEYGAFLATRVALFREWAEDTGRTLDPGFERRSAHSAYTERDYQVLVPPALALAEFEGGRLRFVSPCCEASETITVEDRLEALERTSPPENGGKEYGQWCIGRSQSLPR